MSAINESVASAAVALTGDSAIVERMETCRKRTLLVSALTEMRLQAGLTQAQVAERMGCTASKVSKLEAACDADVRWGDIAAYSNAVDCSMSILFDEKELPAAARIKQHVFAIRDLLDSLADIAEHVNGDKEITGKIHQFYGEVLLNFALNFDGSYQKLVPYVKVEPDNRENSESHAVSARRKNLESPVAATV
jgi:transcriptional regulator with XRE-family HTH domain